MVVAIDNAAQEAHGQAQLLKINDPGKDPKKPKKPKKHAHEPDETEGER